MSMAAIAIGTTAVSVAGGITSAAMQANAAKKAAGASSGAGKKFIKQQTQDVAMYDSQLQNALSTYNANITGISSAISNIDPKIKIPDFSLLGTPDVYKKNKKGEIVYNKKTGLPKIKNRGQASAVLESIKAANQVTENSLYQLENVLPGAADARARAMESLQMWEERLDQQYNQVQKAFPMLERAAGQYQEAGKLLQEQLPQLRQAREVAGEYLLGDLPDVTKKQITRAIAETGGAGYNPATAGRTSGFQLPQGMLSQNLAQAAEERQRFGLSAVSNISQQTAAMSAGQANIAQGLQGVGLAYGQAGAASANIGEAARGMQATNMAWQNLSQGFLQNVPQMMGVALTGRGQDIGKKQFEIQAALDQQNMLANLATGQFNAATGVAGSIYDARSGLSQSRYGVAQSNISNQLASRQAGAQMASDIGQGIGQLGMTGYGLYNQYATAANASTTPMSSGFYRGQIGAANAYGVAPSQVRQYGNQGWSLA